MSPNEKKPEHSRGGSTTKDDVDLGINMLQGSPSEPVGPEDAFGVGPKRGDYTGRVGDGAGSYTSRLRPDGTVEVVRQDVLAEQIGEEPGRKGGVDA